MDYSFTYFHRSLTHWPTQEISLRTIHSDGLWTIEVWHGSKIDKPYWKYDSPYTDGPNQRWKQDCQIFHLRLTYRSTLEEDSRVEGCSGHSWFLDRSHPQTHWGLHHRPLTRTVCARNYVEEDSWQVLYPMYASWRHSTGGVGESNNNRRTAICFGSPRKCAVPVSTVAGLPKVSITFCSTFESALGNSFRFYRLLSWWGGIRWKSGCGLRIYWFWVPNGKCVERSQWSSFHL